MFEFRKFTSSVLAITVCVFGWSFPADAQDTHCDLELKKLAMRLGDNPQRYQLRSDRCEGRYIEQVIGSTLEIVSFTSAFADYSLDTGNALVVEWPSLGGEDIILRGRSLEPKIYYRMDSVRPADSVSFRWPLEILAPLRIEKRLLGVVGTIQRQIGTRKRAVLVPLRIAQGEKAPAPGPYKLLARPGAELEEVYVTLAALDADGEVRDYLMDEEALEFGFYPAERVFDVPLPDDMQLGIYSLLIAASLANSGGTATVEAYLIVSRSR